MSNVVYSEAEQLQLQELTAASSQFNSFIQLILKAQHQGQDARVVVQAVNFFEAMAKQTQDQIESLKSSALRRATEPKQISEIKNKKK